MTMGPYIGIAGITSREQVDAIVTDYPSDAPPLAMGVLASYKTLIQKRPNRYPNRYPAWYEIPGIWSQDKRIRQVLHYSFAEDDTVPARSASQLVDELTEVGAFSGVTWQRAWLQVNARPMIRPWQAEALARVASQWSRIIVQVSATAIDAWLGMVGHSIGNEMRHVLAHLEAHREKVTLLFDASGGKGLPVDVVRITPLVALCQKLGWDCGVAGGLAPDNLHRLRPLWPVSVDTESWPRDADDQLDVAKAIAFRDAARELHR